MDESFLYWYLSRGRAQKPSDGIGSRPMFEISGFSMPSEIMEKILEYLSPLCLGKYPFIILLL